MREYPEEIRRFPVLSHEELIGRTLAFANRGDRAAFWLVWTGVKLPFLHIQEMHDGQLGGFPGAFRAIPWAELLGLKDTSPDHVRGWVDAQRKALVKALEKILAGETAALRQKCQRHAAGLVQLLVKAGDEPVYRYFTREAFTSPTPPIARVLLMLMEREELCRCKHCGAFFVASWRDQQGRRGPKAKAYCSPEHADEADRANATKRMARMRRRQKAAAKK